MNFDWKKPLTNINRIIWSIGSCLLFLIITNCFPNESRFNQITPQPEKPSRISSATATNISLTEISTTSTPSVTPNSEGLLLLQSDADEYIILDIPQQSQYLIDLPNNTQSIDLTKHLSPSKTQLLLLTSNGKLLRFSLITGEVQGLKVIPDVYKTINLPKIVEEVQQTLPNLEHTEDGILSALLNTITQSMQNARWFGSDRYLLTVSNGSETSTNLNLVDLDLETETPLDEAPGMVENFWISPDREKVLLKKGLVTDPGTWQEDSYYIVSIQNRSITPLPMPDDVNNPGVSWFTKSQIGITHQLDWVGGYGFSLVDINTLESTRVLTEQFSHITAYNDHLLTLNFIEENKSTHFAVRNQMGTIISEANLDGRCSLLTSTVTNRVVVNCEAYSFLIFDDALNEIPFTDSLRLFSQSPDLTSILLVTRNHEITLLDAEFNEQMKPDLVGEPMEALWLPDSSGFLYRSFNQIYYFDLSSQTNHLLLTSDFFLDYRNLNAEWIVMQ